MDPVIKPIRIKRDGSTDSETVYGEQIANDTFKLLENPILSCRINYGTIVRVITEKNGELTMSNIVRASEYKTRQFFIDPNSKVVDWGEEIGKSIIESGGMWEIVMQGICFIHLPKNSVFDLDKLFRDNNYHPSEIIDDSNGSA